MYFIFSFMIVLLDLEGLGLPLFQHGISHEGLDGFPKGLFEEPCF